MATRNEVRSWVVDIENEVKDADFSVRQEVWGKRSIYRVPAFIKDLNKKVYEPQIVSFGPYHHGDPNLRQMEEHKKRALIHFLRRVNTPLDDFVAGMEEIVEQLQESYDDLGDEWSDKDRFLQLMIIDGCFMLEVIRFTNHTRRERVDEWGDKDPIFSTHGMLHTWTYIRRDMLMIENQLPLLVLLKLTAIEDARSGNEHHINLMVLEFCAPGALSTPEVELCLHPLDIFRRSLLQRPQERSRSTPGVGLGLHSLDLRSTPSLEELTSNEIMRSAVELHESGIGFQKSKSNSLHDIKFQRGVLTLPEIVVDDDTEYMFVNLIAFERLHVGAGNEVTDYVSFMDRIVDSEKDVSLLHSKGIIQNALGNDKALATLFNSLAKETVPASNRLEDVQRNVNDYCKKSRNVWRANLIHTYFQSPWSVLSLVAAIFLLVFTLSQTVYTIYPYYHPAH